MYIHVAKQLHGSLCCFIHRQPLTRKCFFLGSALLSWERFLYGSAFAEVFRIPSHIEVEKSPCTYCIPIVDP